MVSLLYLRRAAARSRRHSSCSVMSDSGWRPGWRALQHLATLAIISPSLKATATSQGLASEPGCPWAAVYSPSLCYTVSSTWNALPYLSSCCFPTEMSAPCTLCGPSCVLCSLCVLCRILSWYLAPWWRFSVHQACEKVDASVIAPEVLD